MKNYLKLHVLMVSLLVLSSTTFAEDNCIYLDVRYSPEYLLDKPICTHGGGGIVTSGYIRMAQGPVYGPDCTIKATSASDPKKFVVFRAQQNYCFWSAGDIHVSQKSASQPSLKIKYKITGGGYASSTAGTIDFNGF